MKNVAGDIISALPYNNRRKMEYKDHRTDDIITTIERYHGKHNKDYDGISDHFWKGSAPATAQALFGFLKEHVTYDVEPEEIQTVKSPGRLLHDGHGDCKHYASFITGVCDSLRRKGYPIRSKYRFVSDAPQKEIHHVFAVVGDGQKDYWVDPVLKRFDQRPKFYNIKDADMSKGIGAVYYLSGVNGVASVGEIEGAFRTEGDVLGFMRKFKVRPAMFVSPHHFALYAAHHLKRHPKDRMHPDNFLPKELRRFKPKMGESGLEGIGKKKGGGKFLQAIKKGAQKLKSMTLKVSLAAARGPFLSLVALNAFNLARRLHDSLVNPKIRPKLLAKWKSIGGEHKGLIKAVNSGYRLYKRKHGGYVQSRDSIKGIGWVGGFVGAVQIAALLALASAIIAMIKPFLKPSKSDDAAMANGAKDGAFSIADNAVNAGEGGGLPQLPGGNSGSMSVRTSVAPDGTPQLTVDNATLPANAPPVIDPAQNQPADQVEDTAPDAISKPGQFFSNAGGKIKATLTQNKVPVALAVGGIMIYKAMSGPQKGKTGRLVMAGALAGATFFGLQYWEKK